MIPFLNACAGPLRPPPTSFEGQSIPAEGSEDLLLPAVKWSAGRNAMAFVARVDGPDDTVLFELITIRDEPAWIEATPDEGDGWDFRASVGRFGDLEREQALLETLAQRLEALREAL